MARSLLLGVLEDVLGKYVEGLTKENLKVGVWSGKIELFDLKLKASAVDELNLPISAERGYVKSVLVRIPWTQLESKPVVVEIDGVYLQAAPLDLTSLTVQQAKQLIQRKRRLNLDEVEQGVLKTAQESSAFSADQLQSQAKRATYVQQLTTKIVDNLEINITNVHVRYEDCLSDPLHAFSCGLTIERISLSTTDGNWQRSFVSRDATTKAETSINKLGAVEGLGIYWNSRGFKRSATMPFSEWEQYMSALIRYETSSLKQQPPLQLEPMRYMLPRETHFLVKLISTEQSTADTPKLDLLMTSSELPFRVTGEQLSQLKGVGDCFGEMDRRKVMMTHRPEQRPTVNPRAWWQYAYRLITGKSAFAERDRYALLRICIRAHVKYIPYCEKALIIKELLASSSSGSSGSTSATDAEAGLKTPQEMLDFEDQLPMKTLVLLRQQAAKQAAVQLEQLRKSKSQLRTFAESNGLNYKEICGDKKGKGEELGSSSKNTGSQHLSPSRDDTSTHNKGGLFSRLFQRKTEKTDFTSSETGSETSDADSGADADELLMQQIQEKIQQATDSAAAAAESLQAFTLRMHLQTSASVELELNQQPVLKAAMTMQSCVEKRSQNVQVLFELQDVLVRDLATPRPVFPMMVQAIGDTTTSSSDTAAAMNTLRIPRISTNSALGHTLLSRGGSGSSSEKVPQLSASFELRDGRTRLLVSARPLQITWNEICINKTLQFINIKSPAESIDADANFMKRSPLLAASMHRFASDMALPTGYKDITLEIHAPKFVIPEESENADAGCLILDTGKLVVNGELGPPGMTWDLSLKDINAAMPSTMASLFAYPADVAKHDNYLLRPFRIAAEIQTVDNAEAKMTLKMRVLPLIEASIDATKLIRLKRTLDVALRSLRNPDDCIECESAPRSSTSILNRNIPTNPKMPSVVPKTADEDAFIADDDRLMSSESEEESIREQTTLAVSISLPSVKLLLTISEQHSAELGFDLIEFQFLKRPYDVNFYFKVHSMVLKDSTRPEAFQAIIMTNTAAAGEETSDVLHGLKSEEQQLMRVHFRSVKSPLSSLFEGFQNELSVFSAGVTLAIDPESILRYVPFVAALMDGIRSSSEVSEKDQRQQVTTTTVASNSQLQATDGDAPVATDVFGGTKVSCSLAKMSLVILGLRKTQQQPQQQTSSCGIVEVSTTAALPSELERSFAVEIFELFASFETQCSVKNMRARVRTFEVRDERNDGMLDGKQVVFNKLICKSKWNQEQEQADALDTDEEIPQAAIKAEDKHLLVVEFSKNAGEMSVVSVTIIDITTHFAVDIVLNLVEKTLQNVNAMNALLAALSQGSDANNQKPAASSTAVSVGVQSKSSNLAAVGGIGFGVEDADDEEAESVPLPEQGVSVTVKVIDPRLVFIEDPCSSNSKAFVSTCGIHFSFMRQSTMHRSNGALEVKDVMHLAMTDAEIFVVTDLENARTPHKVVDPTEVILNMKRISEQNVLLRNSYTLVLTEIAARLSLNDIVLIQSILARAQQYQAEGPPTTAAERSHSSSLDIAPAGGKEVDHMVAAPNVTVNEYRISAPDISIHILNDFNNQNVPIARIFIKNGDATFNGVSQYLDGDAALLLYADYYNLGIHSWEPVIEKWQCNVTYQKSLSGTVLTLQDENSLLINVSGTLCRCLYTAVELYERIGKDGSYGTQRDIYPLKIKNELGVPVELVDSVTKTSLLILMDEVEHCIPVRSIEKGHSRSLKLRDFPDLFDLHLISELEENHQPIFQISGMTTRPKKYTFQPSKSTLARLASSRIISSAPIIEEVYENSRFNTFTMEWGDPWPQLSDPPKWTNCRGRECSSPGDITLPLNWSWVEPHWVVDKSGAARKEVDNEGFEYATSFGAFVSSNHKRRTKRALDCVRRRRIIRTRTPFSMNSTNSDGSSNSTSRQSSALTIFWSVTIAEDESRLIRLSTAVEIVNSCSDRLEVKMFNRGSEQVSTGSQAESSSASNNVFSVSAGAVRSCPLLSADCEFICFRPAGGSEWSSSIDCKLRTDERSREFRRSERIVWREGHNGLFNAAVHLHLSPKGVLKVTCSPTVVVFNRLPCPMSLCCTDINRTTEKFDLAAGGSGKLRRVSGLDSNVLWNISLGLYSVTSKLPKFQQSAADGVARIEEFDLQLFDGTSESSFRGSSSSRSSVSEMSSRLSMKQVMYMNDVLTVSLKLIVLPEGAVQMIIYSKFLCIDRSRSNLIIRTSCKSSVTGSSGGKNEVIGAAGAMNVERRTFDSEKKLPVLTETQSTEEGNEEGNESCMDFQHQWITGGDGVVMFQGDAAAKQTVSLGVNGGRGWLHDLALDSFGPSKTPVEIVEENTLTGHYLSLSVTSLESNAAFSATRVLTVMPSISIVNHTDEEINLLHPSNRGNDFNKLFSIAARSSRNFIRPGTLPGTTVRMRCESSLGSLGRVDLNEVGTTVLLLPKRTGVKSGSDRHSCVVLQVEVKLALPEDPAYITVLIYRPGLNQSLVSSSNSISMGNTIAAAEHSGATLSVRNETALSIVARQGNVDDAKLLEYSSNREIFDLQVLPDEWVPFGWVDPDAGTVMHLDWSTGDASGRFEEGCYCAINVLEQVGKSVTVPLMNSATTDQQQQIKISVELLGNGLLVRITCESVVAGRIAAARNASKLPISATSPSDLRVVLQLRCVVVSFIAETPRRREFAAIYFDRVRATALLRRSLDTASADGEDIEVLELEVMDVQIDNFADALVYPVLIHTFDGDERKQAEFESRKSLMRANSIQRSEASPQVSEEAPPFFVFFLHRHVPRGCSTAVVKKAALRMLEVNLAIDSSTIILFFCDMYSDLCNAPMGAEMTSRSDSESESSITLYNRAVLTQQRSRSGDFAVDAEAVFQRQLAAKKIFIESLEVHPIKVTISFVVSTFPRDLRCELQQLPKMQWLSSLQRVAAIEGFALKIGSLLVNNALETPESVTTIIASKIRNEMTGKLAQIAGGVFGSLQVLGKPADLYRKLGTGVQDFFYEPYLGAMESPSSFLVGIGKGTNSLVTGAASGLIGSTATILGSATSGVSSVAKSVIALSGDVKFMRAREERRREQRAGQGGIFSGLKAGGENFFSGVTSGFTGLVTDPYENGKKDGALGFMRGVGKGLVGVAVKPVLGVTDGITSIAEGFSQQVADESIRRNRVRRARAFRRAQHDFDALVLTELDLFATEAQYLVRTCAVAAGNKGDEYIGSSTLGFAGSAENSKLGSTRDAEVSSRASKSWGVVVSSKFVRLLSWGLEIVWEIYFSNLSHVVQKDDISVEFLLYQISSDSSSQSAGLGSGATGNTSRRIVVCANKAHALQLYSLLATCAHRMGNPSAVQSPGNIENNCSSSSSSLIGNRQNSSIRSSLVDSTAADVIDTDSTTVPQQRYYIFGTANAKSVFPFEAGDNAAIISRARSRFACVPFEEQQPAASSDVAAVASTESVSTRYNYYKMLDVLLWQLVWDWKENHNSFFNPSRCCATLLINECESRYVQLLGQLELKEGADVVILSVGSGYDADSRTLQPRGGAAVVFAFGSTPSLVDLAHVKVKVSANAFIATVSTRAKTGSACQQQDGWRAAFQEKTVSDYWMKNVLSVTEATY